MDDNKSIIRDFLKKSKNIKSFGDADDLFKCGYIDSIFSLQLIVYLEKTFKIRISNKDIKEENFRSIDNIAETVERLINK